MGYKEAFERIKTYCNSDNGYPYNQYLQSSTPKNEDLEIIEKALEDYSNIKNKIENRTLIGLPYYIGQTVYVIADNHYYESKITALQIRKNGVSNILLKGYPSISLSISKLNKVWFLTKEEAKAKLKELKEKE